MMATFSGTDLGYGGNDRSMAVQDGDLILGGSGDDLINGDAGDDIILGGKGFDEIYGGPRRLPWRRERQGHHLRRRPGGHDLRMRR